MSYIHVQKTNKNKRITCQFASSSSGSCGRSPSQQLRAQAGTHPGQDALPQHRAHSHSQPHSLRLNTQTHQFTYCAHLGVWEETAVPRENPYRNGEKVQIPHKQVTAARNHFFFSHRYNEMTLYGMTLFEDLLCFYST